jgi:uncharacterized membrane protein
MKNKFVGILLIVLSLLLGFIVISFNKSINNIAKASCSDIINGLSCPIIESINFQTKMSLGMMAFLILFGLYLIFFGERIITNLSQHKKITKEEYKNIIVNLNEEEKNIFENIIESQGSIFQSELVDKTKLTKVKITRILDRLEGKGLIERKRRGMTNIIILKI